MRLLSSLPVMHRMTTLQAISDKTHAMTARIEFLKAKGVKIASLLGEMPQNASSRISWLNSKLQEM